MSERTERVYPPGARIGRCRYAGAQVAFHHQVILSDYSPFFVEWNETRDDLIQWMQDVRELMEEQSKLQNMRKRAEGSLSTIYTTFALSQPSGTFIPTLPELAMMEEFVQPLNSVALDQAMPDGALDSAISRIPGLIAEWRTQVDDSLLNLLRQSSAYAGRNDLTRDVLSYASTAFTCARCPGALRYPDIFVHPCFASRLKEVDVRLMAPGSRMTTKSSKPRKPSKSCQDIWDDASFVQDAFSQTSGYIHRVWYPGRLLQFSDAMHYHTVSLLDRLNMDRTTTSETLLDLNPFVEGMCQCFSVDSRFYPPATKLVTRWSQIVRFLPLKS